MKEVAEYRVRPVTRYVITRYHEGRDGTATWGGCETLGEFDNEQQAERVKELLKSGDPCAVGNVDMVVW